MINKWKKALERLFSPIGKALAKLPITPNFLSLLGLFSSIIAAYFIIINDFLLSVIFILVAGFFDMVDGLVARTKGQATKFGEVLDSVLDRYSDGIIFVALIYSGVVDAFWALLALLGSFITSYSRAKGEIMKLKMSGVGLIERPERIILICVGLLTLVYLPISFLGYSIFDLLMIVIAVLTNLSVLQRMTYIRKKLESSQGA
ncbi:MAG: archaetidylinositol phosphate synthase [Candidatus Asgardarchaeia archaeon]